MHFVLYVAAIVFLFTAFAYGTSSKGVMTGGLPAAESTENIQPNAAAVSPTLLEAMLQHGLIVWVIYFYAIFCWYVTMLLETYAQSGGVGFVEGARADEQAVAQGLAVRVQGGQP